MKDGDVYRIKPYAGPDVPTRWLPCDIYFVRGEESGSIKIGMTGNVKRRLRLLRVNTPEKLALILVIHGPRMLERLLHFHFRHLNIHGEWFKPGEDLLAFIADRALNGWSLAEQRKWMSDVADVESAEMIAQIEEWVRTNQETENEGVFL